MCVCVGESVCLHVHTLLFFFLLLPVVVFLRQFFLTFFARIFFSVSRCPHCTLPADRLDRCSRLPARVLTCCARRRREVGEDYKRMRCTQGTGSPDGPSFDRTDITNSHMRVRTHTHTHTHMIPVVSFLLCCHVLKCP